jgi:hypothetical protein
MPHVAVSEQQRKRAKLLRQTMTRAETLLWRYLKANRSMDSGFADRFQSETTSPTLSAYRSNWSLSLTANRMISKTGRRPTTDVTLSFCQKASKFCVLQTNR